MPYAELPARKNIRLNSCDYSSAGYYFITICVKDSHELLWIPAPVGAHSVRPPLSEPAGAHIVRPPLSDIGKTVEKSITNIPLIYESVGIDKYVIMPNHIHIIISIDCVRGRTMCAPTIARVVKQCKEYVTKQIGYSIWQKSYHDHIIRDEPEYQRIWQYINENPSRWQDDCYFVK